MLRVTGYEDLRVGQVQSLLVKTQVYQMGKHSQPGEAIVSPLTTNELSELCLRRTNMAIRFPLSMAVSRHYRIPPKNHLGLPLHQTPKSRYRANLEAAFLGTTGALLPDRMNRFVSTSHYRHFTIRHFSCVTTS